MSMNQAMSVLTSQNTNQWYTPPWIIELARETMGGIDLDPASDDIAQQWIQADQYHTLTIPPEIDAIADERERKTAIRRLSRAALADQPQWHGRVWLNPPFDDTPVWAERLSQSYEYRYILCGMLLVNSAPGYAWWESLWRERPVCMLRDRVHFVRPDGSQNGPAKKGQTIAFFGIERWKLEALWSPYGRIIEP